MAKAPAAITSPKLKKLAQKALKSPSMLTTEETRELAYDEAICCFYGTAGCHGDTGSEKERRVHDPRSWQAGKGTASRADRPQSPDWGIDQDQGKDGRQVPYRQGGEGRDRSNKVTQSATWNIMVPRRHSGDLSFESNTRAHPTSRRSYVRDTQEKDSTTENGSQEKDGAGGAI
ncbi:hypothetical protein HDF16_006308 [Granulicella aggregans]|uniref:Uncharacterized protein n=1 Tax=Granulicella aggregans TaxID=474949 RepID=A0A7W7ZKR9_9BACT|nr:hypothetical protein [Granulicella aggregans]